ncbi:single-stranded DNA-binding protein [Methylocystis sp. IM2]
MSFTGTLSGYVFRDPETRTAKSGKDYAIVTVKDRNGERNDFWRCMIFGDAIAAAMELRDGEFCEVTGEPKFELYTDKEGKPRIGLSLLSREIARAEPQQKRQAREDAPRPPAGQPADWRARQGRQRTLEEMAANGGDRHMPARGHAGLDDDIPF